MNVFRSAPAQNASPAPVRIATSTESSPEKSSQMDQSSSCVSGSTAFLASGRLSVTYAIRSRFSYRTFGIRHLRSRRSKRRTLSDHRPGGSLE